MPLVDRAGAEAGASSTMTRRFGTLVLERPLAPLLAGLLLAAIGAWNAAEPLLAAYPGPRALEFFEGEAFDDARVIRKRGALMRFLSGPSVEYQAVLQPGNRIVLYSDDMPRFEAVSAAIVSGPATYGVWPDAREGVDRLRIWSLETASGPVITREQAVSGLRASRRDAAVLPGAVTLFGLLLAGAVLRRWRRD